VDPNAQPVSALAQGPIAPPEDKPKPRSNALAFVALGVGGAALAFGGVTGVLALGKRSDLEKICSGDDRCPSSASGDLDAYRRLGLMSGIGLGVGVAAAATGVTLLLTRPKAAPSAAAAPEIRPFIGLLGVGATGRF
jgi:hypothetical protein